MTRYELKKVFVKTSNRIALLMILLTLLIVSYLSVCHVDYVDEEGETQTGIAAIHKLQAAKQEWNGALTEEKLAAVIEENARIIATPEYQSKDVAAQNTAYGWRQGISDIRELINCAFGGFQEYDYYKTDTLVAADASKFYSNRILHLKEWLASEGQNLYSDEEKQFLIDRYEKLTTPFYYEEADGWDTYLLYAPTLIMITMLILAFLVTGIFSSEFALKADAIFFAAYYGRNRASLAKVKAGLLMVTGIYWSVMLLYTAIVLGCLGTGGAHAMIQTSHAGWKSLYYLTNLQVAGIVVAGGYVGCLFISLLTMLVSAKTRNSVLAVLVPFVLIFVPSFISGSSIPLIGKIIGLLPDQLLMMRQVLSTFGLYTIAGRIFLSAGLLFALYGALSILLCPLLYHVYRNTETR